MPAEIQREEVRRLVEAGAQLVEVLPSEEYANEHLPGAISLPLEGLSGETAARLRRDRAVVVYCFDAQ